MEFRIRIPSLRALLPIVIVLAAVGGFMAADRLTLHWYVPEDTSGEVATLESEASKAQSDIALFAEAIDRLGTAVTINSLVSNLGGVPGARLRRGDGLPRLAAVRRGRRNGLRIHNRELDRHWRGQRREISPSRSGTPCSSRGF